MFTYCLGVAHPQGFGKLRKVPCQVKFDFIIPEDLDKTPYVLFYSKGIHTHQAPPPIKTPIQILEGLVKVIRRLSSPVMTNCK
jgi:hypothetical protein